TALSGAVKGSAPGPPVGVAQRDGRAPFRGLLVGVLAGGAKGRSNRPIAQGAGLAHQVAAQVAEDLGAEGAPGDVGVEVAAIGTEDDGDAEVVVAAVLGALEQQLQLDGRLAAQAEPR